MTFAIYFTLTWILLGSLILYKSNLPFKLAALIFLVACFIHSQAYHLLPENFKGFTVNGQLSPYISYLLWRSIIVPSFLVLCYKLFYFQKTIFGSLLFTSFFYSVSMAGLEQIGDLLHIFKLEWWNFYWAFFYYFLLFITTYLLSFVFLRMEEP